MKTNFSFFKISFFLGLFFLLTSSSKQENILGRWDVYKLISNGKTKKVTGSVGEMWLDIQSDGILLLGNGDKSKRGKWHLDEKNNLLYISERAGKDAKEMKVNKLTSTTLILTRLKSYKKDKIFMRKVDS